MPGLVAARLGAAAGVGTCPRLYAVPVPGGRTLWVAWCSADDAGGPTYALLVHDPTTGSVTTVPPRIDGRLTAAAASRQGAKPFVVFRDLDGDGRLEIAVPEVVSGERADARAVVARWFHVQPTTELLPFLTLETARPWPFFKEGPGTLVRRVEPGAPGTVRVVVRFLPEADPRAARDLGTVDLARNASGVWTPVARDATDPAFDELLWDDGTP